MFTKAVIGVDIGGTKISVAKVEANQLNNYIKFNISAQSSEKKIMGEIINAIKKIYNNDVAGIGVGVPSLVDTRRGIVYNVQNIPAWKEVHLKDKLESHFNVPVYINNDANCFAVGVKHFDKGKNFTNLVGLTIGTGLGAGIIIANRLYSGVNCGAGEFGSIPYKNHTLEYYCSGQYFIKEHNTDGKELYVAALSKDNNAIKIFKQFGQHLGDAINTILYTVDPEAIIIGGSVSHAFNLFKKTMWEQINKFQYKHAVDRLTIEIAERSNIAVLGAATLYYDAQNIDLNSTNSSKRKTKVYENNII